MPIEGGSITQAAPPVLTTYSARHSSLCQKSERSDASNYNDVATPVKSSVTININRRICHAQFILAEAKGNHQRFFCLGPFPLPPTAAVRSRCLGHISRNSRIAPLKRNLVEYTSSMSAAMSGLRLYQALASISRWCFLPPPLKWNTAGVVCVYSFFHTPPVSCMCVHGLQSGRGFDPVSCMH